MALNTKIRLPHHAQSRRVVQVIARLMGVPFEVKNHDGRIYALDEMHEGGWHLDFSRKSVRSKSAELGDGSYCYLCCNPPHGEPIEWIFHTEDGDNEDAKTLSTPANPLGAAVGSHLVAFFGGELVPLDSNDRVAVAQDPETALFPPAQKYQTGDERWSQFYEALWQFQPLTPRDFLEAAGLVQYSPTECFEQHRDLLKYLGALELEQKLSQLPEVAVKRSSPRL